MIDPRILRPGHLVWICVGVWALLAACSSDEQPSIPAEAVRLVEEGQALLKAGKAKAAEEKATRALSVERAFADAHLLRGEALWRQNLLGPAVEAFREGLPFADTGDGTLEKRLGELAASVQDHDLALLALEAAWKRGVDDTRVLQLLAEEYSHAARGDEALSIFGQLERREPRSSDWPIEVGRLHLDLGRLSEARSAFERARAADPVSARPWAELGGLAVQEGDLEEAERCYLRSLDIDPDQGRVLFQLAMIASRREDSDRARQYQARYEELVRRQQTVSDAQRRQNHLRNMNRLARRALSEGDDAEARPFLERYVAIDPDDDKMRQLLVNVYERLGLTEEAARLRDR